MAVTEINGTCGSPSRGKRGLSPVYLRNGLCLRSLLHDVAEFGTIGSDRETFRQAIALAKDRRLNQRFPGHKILEEIGRGGMGIVYRAGEVRSDRIVALKCVSADSSDEASARFRREAKIAAGLDHPNIVPVYCVSDTKEGLPFFTMKFAPGGTLHQSLTKFQNDPRQSVRLILKVTLAVQYAHERGILHRDLKPANILLDERGEPLVSDFGLAKSLNGSAELTRTLAILGTAGYLAPEQAQGPPMKITAAADIYSLGTVLFELLTGRTPFIGEEAFSIIRQAAESSPPRLRSLVPQLDRDLEIICERCLQIEPRHRFESASALADDLSNWLNDRPIRARAPKSYLGISRWVRRNRTLGGLIVVSLIAAVASLAWQIRNWKTQTTLHQNVLAAHSVGILPFVNLDELTPDVIFAQSITGSLQGQLTALGEARVVFLKPAQSAAGYGTADEIKKIGRSAAVRTVLTGSIRTVAGKRRLSVRLLDVATGEPLFVQTLEDTGQADLGRRFAVTWSPSIYEILSSNDSPSFSQSETDPGLSNQIAREAILAGRDLMLRYTTSDLDRAINLFKKAIMETPESSLAHSYLAFAATARTHYIADWSYLKLGRDEAMKAIQLSPKSAEAHRALGSVYYQEGRFGDALEEGMQTVETGGLTEKSARFLGMTFETVGHLDRALDWYSLTSRLRGTPGDVEAHIGDCWVKLGDDRQALAAYIRSTELQPTWPHGGIGICHMRMLEGEFKTAHDFCEQGGWNHPDLGDSKAMEAQIEFFARNFQRAIELYREIAVADPAGGGAFYGAVSYESALGRAKQAAGEKQGAREVLERCLARETYAIKRESENPETFYRLAAVESSLGMLDRSAEHLFTSVRLGWVDRRSLEMDPRFDAVRASPGFQQIVDAISAKLADMKLKITNTNSRRNDQWITKIGMN